MNLLQEFEDIWLREWQDKIGSDTPLSEESQTKLHELRVRFEHQIGKPSLGDRVARVTVCVIEEDITWSES